MPTILVVPWPFHMKVDWSWAANIRVPPECSRHAPECIIKVFIVFPRRGHTFPWRSYSVPMALQETSLSFRCAWTKYTTWPGVLTNHMGSLTTSRCSHGAFTKTLRCSRSAPSWQWICHGVASVSWDITTTPWERIYDIMGLDGDLRWYSKAKLRAHVVPAVQLCLTFSDNS